MKASELIKILNDMPQDADIVIESGDKLIPIKAALFGHVDDIGNWQHKHELEPISNGFMGCVYIQ